MKKRPRGSYYHQAVAGPDGTFIGFIVHKKPNKVFRIVKEYNYEKIGICFLEKRSNNNIYI